ncbi:DUF397 domain-containing protein [Streptomyces chumphonensis]|uniref:DUF397 domain-containing protein n=1 Tax=Streptomyces chumphonensis TaxID=1214925 RepID=UPI003D711F9F
MKTVIRDATTLTGWRKSTHSGAQGDCVEVTEAVPGAVPVRDSKNPSGPALVFPAAGWSAFVELVKRDA